MTEWVRFEVEAVEPRFRLLYLANGEFVGLLKALDGRQLLKANGLPDDATVVGVRHEPMYGQFEILVHSEAFDPVLPGVMPPLLDPDIMVRRLELEPAEAPV